MCMTIQDLYNACKEEVEKGNGNKSIMISKDDEGNGYHYLWYSFSKPEEVMLIEEETDSRVAEYKDTIILG